MEPLPPSERRALRAKAHHLHPVVSIGHHGLTPPVLHEIDLALAAHELVKVRVFGDDRAAREQMLGAICTALGCAPVQHLGKLLILWRPRPEPAPATPARPPRRGPRKTVTKPPPKSGKPAARPVSPPRQPLSRRQAAVLVGKEPAAPKRPVARRQRGQPATPDDALPAPRTPRAPRTPLPPGAKATGGPGTRRPGADERQRPASALTPRGAGQRAGRRPAGNAPAPDASRRRRRRSP